MLLHFVPFRHRLLCCRSLVLRCCWLRLWRRCWCCCHDQWHNRLQAPPQQACTSQPCQAPHRRRCGTASFAPTACLAPQPLRTDSPCSQSAAPAALQGRGRLCCPRTACPRSSAQSLPQTGAAPAPLQSGPRPGRCCCPAASLPRRTASCLPRAHWHSPACVRGSSRAWLRSSPLCSPHRAAFRAVFSVLCSTFPLLLFSSLLLFFLLSSRLSFLLLLRRLSRHLPCPPACRHLLLRSELKQGALLP